MADGLSGYKPRTPKRLRDSNHLRSRFMISIEIMTCIVRDVISPVTEVGKAKVSHRKDTI
jgi:hypothetical protein